MNGCGRQRCSLFRNTVTGIFPSVSHTRGGVRAWSRVLFALSAVKEHAYARVRLKVLLQSVCDSVCGSTGDKNELTSSNRSSVRVPTRRISSGEQKCKAKGQVAVNFPNTYVKTCPRVDKVIDLATDRHCEHGMGDLGAVERGIEWVAASRKRNRGHLK